MNLSVRPFQAQLSGEWEALVERSNAGTLFHRLDFLAYHGDRFKSVERHLAFFNGTTACGVLPLAVQDEEGALVATSPYGGSYGGPVFDRTMNYADSTKAVDLMVSEIEDMGCQRCRITLPIAACYKRYSETFRLALFEGGFQCVNRDISSVVELPDKDDGSDIGVTSRSRNMARKARKCGIEVRCPAPWSDFYKVLSRTYAKFSSDPTHSLAQLEWLGKTFPARVYSSVAYLEGEPVGGVCFFGVNARVMSSFYLCQDREFQHTQALSLLVYEALIQCREAGYRFFDFGTSSVGQKGRDNVFRFKESFGAIGQFRETYAWSG